VLVVKQPWLDKILAGEKTWEIRSTNSTKRGKIHLALSQGGGRILGHCTLVDSFALDRRALAANKVKHRIMDMEMVKYPNPHAWVLGSAQRYTKPLKYKHPQGAVVWASF
jgi:hypothetical protein